MKYIASCSFGKDSLALILKLLELNYPLDEVIFYDSGVEFQAIYSNKNKLKTILESKNIRFTELKPTYNFIYLMTEKPVQKRDFSVQNGYKWCGGRCRWGTTYKLQSIKNHYKKYNDFIVEYVGIAADEQERLLRERIKVCSNKIKLYPLAEWQMTEKDCLDYCYKNGWNWLENDIELYSVLDRVSCWCCRNKNLKELKNIYNFLPNYWENLRELQKKIDIPFRNKSTIFELENQFKNQSLTDKNSR